MSGVILPQIKETSSPLHAFRRIAKYASSCGHMHVIKRGALKRFIVRRGIPLYLLDSNVATDSEGSRGEQVSHPYYYQR
jgi:hypothetical protein